MYMNVTQHNWSFQLCLCDTLWLQQHFSSLVDITQVFPSLPDSILYNRGSVSSHDTACVWWLGKILQCIAVFTDFFFFIVHCKYDHCRTQLVTALFCSAGLAIWESPAHSYTQLYTAEEACMCTFPQSSWNWGPEPHTPGWWSLSYLLRLTNSADSWNWTLKMNAQECWFMSKWGWIFCITYFSKMIRMPH